MIQTGFETRIKVQNIVSSQLPDFILDESPKTVDFLKQYYISQEYQGGTIDLTENLDQYLNFDNLTPEVIVDSTSISAAVSSTDTTIGIVGSTKGFPKEYGLLKINDEIITYTGITTNSFTGCIRGFSGITSYAHDINREELVFTSSSASEHNNGSSVQNLSSLFLKEIFTWKPQLSLVTIPFFSNHLKIFLRLTTPCRYGHGGVAISPLYFCGVSTVTSTCALRPLIPNSCRIFLTVVAIVQGLPISNSNPITFCFN